MIALHDFNRLPEKESLALLHPCVAIPGWAEALVRGRPYSRREDLFSTALALTQCWDETALTQARAPIRVSGKSQRVPWRRQHCRGRNRAR